MEKEEDILKNRLLELSKIAHIRGINTYSNFLNLAEQDFFHRFVKKDLYTSYKFNGGYELAERQIVSFSPDALCYENNPPIIPISIRPKSIKYSDKLTHRDYLGTILGLGIERNKIGDILVDDNETIVFIHESLHTFISDSLTRVKNTFVEVCTAEISEITYSPKFQEIRGTVPSIRLDAIISLVLNESRSKLIRLIEGGKVYVNGRLITTNAYKIQELDLISIRGYGKFQFDKIENTTKKNRIFVSIKKFI